MEVSKNNNNKQNYFVISNSTSSHIFKGNKDCLSKKHLYSHILQHCSQQAQHESSVSVNKWLKETLGTEEQVFDITVKVTHCRKPASLVREPGLECLPYSPPHSRLCLQIQLPAQVPGRQEIMAQYLHSFCCLRRPKLSCGLFGLVQTWLLQVSGE